MKEVLGKVFEVAKTIPESTLKYLTNMDQAHVTAKVMPIYREEATRVKPYIKKAY